MSYHIEGRRWFQRTYGNTYNSVTIYKDGVEVAYLPMEYGYGDYYLQRACEWLMENGHPEMKEKHSNGVYAKHNTVYLRETLGASWSVCDVQRKKDL